MPRRTARAGSRRSALRPWPPPGLARGRIADDAQVGLDRLGAERLDPRLVHIGVIEGADLGGVGGGRSAHAIGAGLHDGADARLGGVAQHLVVAEAHAVGRDFGPLVPAAVGVGEEVVARLHRRVLAGGVKTPLAVVERLLGRRGDGDANGQGCERGGAQEQSFHWMFPRMSARTLSLPDGKEQAGVASNRRRQALPMLHFPLLIRRARG